MRASPARPVVVANGSARSADGRFESPPLSAGVYVVRAVAADGSTADGVCSLGTGERAEIELDLSVATGILRGRVLHEDGTAFRGPIRLSRTGFHGGDRTFRDMEGTVLDARTVATDERGGFSVSDLATGAWELEVGDETLRLSFTVQLPIAEPIEVVFPAIADATELLVRSRASGAPVSGAVAEWTRWADPVHVTLRRISGPDGRFMAPDTQGLHWVAAEGFLRWGGSGAAESLKDRTIDLDRPASVHGRVTSRGRPVPGIHVGASVWDAPETTSPDASSVTDADGRYAITGLRAGEVSLRVNAEEGVGKGQADLPPEQLGRALDYDPLAIAIGAGEDSQLDIELVSAARLTGRVLDAAGRPKAGVPILVYVPGYAYISSTMEPSYWNVATATTDGDGRYAVAGLATPQSYRVEAGRGASTATSRATFERGRTEQTCDLVLRATGSFQVRVVDRSTHEGVAGVSILAKTESLWSWCLGTTAEGGYVQMGPLLRADFEIEAGRSGEAQGRLRVSWPSNGEDPETITMEVSRTPQATQSVYRFRLEPRDLAANVPLAPHPRVASADSSSSEGDESFPVAGTILDPSGRGLRGLRLRLLCPGVTEPFTSRYAKAHVDRTDGAGRFRLTARGDEQEVLVLNVPRSFADVPPIPVVRGGPPLEIRLRDSVEVRVKVVTASGNGLPEWNIRAWSLVRSPYDVSNLDWSSRPAYGGTDEAGEALLSGLDPEAEYSLGAELVREGQPKKEREIVPWRPGPTTITIREPRTVHGVVRNPGGEPLAGAHVHGFVGRKQLSETVSAADGTFSLEDKIGEGFSVYATFVVWGNGTQSEVVEAPGDGRSISLTLDPGAGLDIRLEGVDVGGRALYVMGNPDVGSREGGELQIGWCDSVGHVVLRGLHTDVPYAIWVAPGTADSVDQPKTDDDGTAFLTGIHAASPPRPLAVRLQAGGRIVARAPGSVSWPSSPSIRAFHGAMSVEGKALADGSFEFRGLCDLDWTVRIESWGGGHRYEGVGRVGETVKLELKRDATK